MKHREHVMTDGAGVYSQGTTRRSVSRRNSECGADRELTRTHGGDFMNTHHIPVHCARFLRRHQGVHHLSFF